MKMYERFHSFVRETAPVFTQHKFDCNLCKWNIQDQEDKGLHFSALYYGIALLEFH